MELKRVVVTGLGAITPLGNTVESYWDGLVKGKSAAGPITRFDATNFKTKFACEVKDFNAEEYLDRKEVRKTDLFAQYAIAAAEQAFQDSGLDLEKIDLDEAGVIWGAGIGGIITFMDEVKAYVQGNGVPRFNPFFIPKMISDIASGHISMKYGFRGPNYGTVSACASSTHAIGDAFNLIRLGKAKVFITGGSEAAINEAGVGGFNALQALSTRNDDPATASRPFDKDRDGFVIGEGGGALILEEYEYAVSRGAHIYCEIVGCGMTADAYHLTAPHPEGLGARKVMGATLKDGNIEPSDVDYINVHGTSTPLGDVAEIKAIKEVFGEHAYKLNISSTKSMTGHLLGGTGAIEAIACILAIKNGIVPPTINNFNLDPELDTKLNFTLNKAQERKVRVAISNTFGFGGHNACVAFKSLE
ncbi:beta-ketoacyl-ACP synthase II [Xiashengella succiniciproducens]|jgi:3-oxoacyl-[acyl-carrier-protein] synthase II|uniref:3-oxoacyl-[acyl-carrier-protein] synthase 2 n=1 Tax=Xiashengella succiniciproducens TaxID=2949635 RepID=A0A9J6ZNQ9_9BACT|nr:beta-ketoacyl-ACP synthase II [Alkaliflexus sp. Ai-910]MDI9538698.1 beta-ketoacyl-ACP synthase II [Bacteroidota bacterium]URW79546.1 beta-ketoacyl-ACP synthase II [Alkaliflexus sp. Ai-910]HHT99718.1 beta-ketoacyl-ACP synthase II [Bacteroidales bacterium]